MNEIQRRNQNEESKRGRERDKKTTDIAYTKKSIYVAS